MILPLILCACVTDEQKSIIKDEKSEINDYEWLEEMRKPRNNLVVEFTYEISRTETESESVEMVSFHDDTTTYSFIAEMPVGCLIIGDLDTNNSDNYLLVGLACNPSDDDIVTESAFLKFTFRIRNHPSLLDKKLLFKTHADLIK